MKWTNALTNFYNFTIFVSQMTNRSTEEILRYQEFKKLFMNVASGGLFVGNIFQSACYKFYVNLNTVVIECKEYSTKMTLQMYRNERRISLKQNLLCRSGLISVDPGRSRSISVDPGWFRSTSVNLGQFEASLRSIRGRFWSLLAIFSQILTGIDQYRPVDLVNPKSIAPVFWTRPAYWRVL